MFRVGTTDLAGSDLRADRGKVDDGHDESTKTGEEQPDCLESNPQNLVLPGGRPGVFGSVGGVDDSPKRDEQARPTTTAASSSSSNGPKAIMWEPYPDRLAWRYR